MALAHRVGPLLGRIAPPGSARRRVLRFGYRAIRALPKLRHRRYVAARLATLGDCVRLRLALFFCRDPLAKERMKGAAECRWRTILDSLAFPGADCPQVSIIIPACNQLWKTLECLQSIGTAPSGPTFEVIVVDDRSLARTARILGSVPGLFTLRNDRKLGAIGSCNRGAHQARGEYLVFLNQDALATPGWLAALAQTFRDIPGTGLAGAQLIRPDGRLLEAGAALCRDGSGWAYGELDDVNHPRYNFAREVDYCTAGCLMVPRTLFLELGGFVTDHGGGSYHDADLAFRIRHSGHKVVYQPTTRVIQHGRLSRRERASSAFKTQEQALWRRFRERWHERLDSHPDPASGLVRLVRPSGAGQAALGQVLVIDHRIPTPDRDSGSFRMMEIIRAIKRRGHHVTLIPDNMAVFSPYLQDLQRVGVEVIYPPYYHSVEEYLVQHGRELNLVIISRADVAARNMETVRRYAPSARIVFDTVDLHFVREERQARLGASPEAQASAARRKEQELRLARLADRTLVVSPIEKAVIENECHRQIDVKVLSNIHPVKKRERPGYEQRRDIVFIGGFDHVPNIDAVLFFALEIFPRVLERIPEVVFQVIGHEPTPEIRRLGSPSINILGFVSEVEPIFDCARVSVAPLRFGAGVKGKVNQSMSLGVPTVVTSIAAEGMYLAHGENAMIADDPESFANAVVGLWTSPDLWRQVSRNGIQSLIDHFSVEAAAQPIDELLEWAGLSASPAK